MISCTLKAKTPKKIFVLRKGTMQTTPTLAEKKTRTTSDNLSFKEMDTLSFIEKE